MWSRRFKETFAVITVGDGAIALLAPRQHALLWEVGPKSARKVACFFADNPNHMRILGLAQIAFGMWLALRQHQER